MTIFTLSAAGTGILAAAAAVCLLILIRSVRHEVLGAARPAASAAAPAPAIVSAPAAAPEEGGLTPEQVIAIAAYCCLNPERQPDANV